MIYVDTSVVLAELLAEDQHPPAAFWTSVLVSSRLLEYEVWARLNAKGLATSHGDAARSLVGRLAMLEMVAPVLSRALEPFPEPVRTLDALHLSCCDFLKDRRQDVRLATYDRRQSAAARSIGIPLFEW